MMDHRQLKTLGRLAELARIKREAELGKLASVAQSRNRLQQALETMRRSEAPLDPAEGATDPALVAARLAHRHWTEGQARRLSQQLAMVTADWLRQKPAAARAFGRAAVLEQLHDRARDDRRAEAAKPR